MTLTVVFDIVALTTAKTSRKRKTQVDYLASTTVLIHVLSCISLVRIIVVILMCVMAFFLLSSV